MPSKGCYILDTLILKIFQDVLIL